MTRNFKLLVDDIAQDKSIVLFCGAGINCTNKVRLSWPDLIDRPFNLALDHIARENQFNEDIRYILKDIFKLQNERDCLPEYILQLRELAINEFPYEIRSAILKSVHGKEYIPLLQEYIYSQCSKKNIRTSFYYYYSKDNYHTNEHSKDKFELYVDLNNNIPRFHTLFILAKFILLYDKLEAIVTYNYDNFLSDAINILADNPKNFFFKSEYDKLKQKWGIDNDGKLNVEVIDIYGKTYNETITKNKVAIFHVHGFIPPIDGSKKCDSSSIILSQDEYCETLSDIQTWQNSTQIHYLCHCTCLFVGSSMTDLTIKRMINFAKENGNEENIYNMDLCPEFPIREKGQDDKEFLEKYIQSTGKAILSKLKSEYLADLGIKSISYIGNYDSLYNEFGRVIYSKTAGLLENSANKRI